MEKKLFFLALLMAVFNIAFSQKLTDIIHVEVTGISGEQNVVRRDPSDIIKVGATYYVWYSKRSLTDGINLFPGDGNGYNGYYADVWYATSDDGVNWVERGLCIKKGNPGDWDGQSAFTPNILVWEGQYYLYYTGVPQPFTNQGDSVTKSAIGLAFSDSPDGPWTKLEKPVLLCSTDPKEFDSMRVDDACIVVRGGKIFLYYKGRQWGESWRYTKTGLAVAEKPEGFYIKHPSNPVIQAGHEVMIWPYGNGIIALITLGPEGLGKTLQYAPEGIHFSTIQHLENYPFAAGFYRPEAFTGSDHGGMPQWGIAIKRCKDCVPGLIRIEMSWEEEID